MGSKVLDSCLICGNTFLMDAVDFGEQPLANSFLEAPEELPKYRLKLKYCRNCTHTQLDKAVDPNLLYKNYKYVSGTTKTLKNHFADLAVDITRQLWPTIYPMLDIGCNDGSLLQEFRKHIREVYGVDPAENLRPITEEKKIPVLVDYWDENTVFKLDAAFNSRHTSFGVITALNCLAHNSNPKGFLLGCKRALANSGNIIIEFPYFGYTLANLDLGQIYAEHHSYFSVKSFMVLVESLNLRIKDFKIFPEIHGGTIRFVVTNSPGGHTLHLGKLIIEEKETILWGITKFNLAVKNTVYTLTEEVYKLKGDRKVIMYGASAKSSTLLNLEYSATLKSLVSYVVDDSEMKQGLFCPGSNLEIKPPSVLLKEKNPIIIITAHNFKEEIVSRLRSMGIKKASIISYTPKVLVEDL